jgi:2-oxoglutarate dehydrogenase E1 component
VKYHLGFRRNFKGDAAEMPITLAPNPSHLEYVNPVVMGRARAAQERRDMGAKPESDEQASLCILIHGDAAFPGEGIVTETLNLGQLPGYRVGGTIHIILNNQIGFTTLPRDSRSTLYASDPAKGFEIPVIHVNADDPEACLAAARLAFAYRNRFHKDFLIDLVGYRRFGHNEGDAPELTQPRMYETIAKHPTVRKIWADQLEREGAVGPDEAKEMLENVTAELRRARDEATSTPAESMPSPHQDGTSSLQAETAVPKSRLVELNEALLYRPGGFTVNAKLESRVFARRRQNLKEPHGIDWGHAESLAFASILADGIPIRMSGQDAERGTFGQRNLVLHDPVTGGRFCPMQSLPQAAASFAIYNSPLSESAVLGFEYGYSMHAKGALVLWEAQFGDFVNVAQVIVDQFLVSGHTKWRQTPSLVLLLPHGYEGMGPEHSSARVERFLQLCAGDNMRVVNCTTAGQYFHVLRRQAALLESHPRPLVVMTPKSLLREPLASSSLEELTEGGFQAVIDDAGHRGHREEVTRLVLCSGKVYVDLIKTEAYKQARNVAVARVEQLYPVPYRELQEILDGYPSLREVMWLQEEPHNMGAWGFMNAHIREMVRPRFDFSYVGRPASASPAVGSGSVHLAEQANILAAALSSVPEPATQRSVAAHVR